MAGKNGDANVEGSRFDRNEQVGFQQAETEAREALVGQYLKGGANDNIAQNVGDTQQQFGVGKDGQFKYATPEQVAKMDDKTLAEYVKQHEEYTRAAVAAHPEKLDKIMASYSTRLSPEVANQTYEEVHKFYGNLGRAIEN